MQYYPSPYQLINTASRLYTPGSTFVIVGGNSIFRGTGQNVPELWSKALQSELGSGYTVVNFSIDQQSMESFGAVLFRLLRQQYQKIIYVGLASENGAGPVDGLSAYKYFFWDTYYLNLLNLKGRDLDIANAIRATELGTREGKETHIGSWLESMLRFRVLWNEVGYRYFFPIWTLNAAGDPFRARDKFIDVADPNLAETQRLMRENAEHHELIKKRLADSADAYMDPANPSELRQNVAAELRRGYDDAFPPEMRSQILAVFLQLNPEYINLLPNEQRVALRARLVRTSETVKQLGYRSIVVGEEFLPDDYIDQGHLMASGGRKLTHRVAEAVRAMTNP